MLSKSQIDAVGKGYSGDPYESNPDRENIS
jgi:hypothetical protein